VSFVTPGRKSRRWDSPSHRDLRPSIRPIPYLYRLPPAPIRSPLPPLLYPSGSYLARLPPCSESRSTSRRYRRAPVTIPVKASFPIPSLLHHLSSFCLTHLTYILSHLRASQVDEGHLTSTSPSTGAAPAKDCQATRAPPPRPLRHQARLDGQRLLVRAERPKTTSTALYSSALEISPPTLTPVASLQRYRKESPISTPPSTSLYPCASRPHLRCLQGLPECQRHPLQWRHPDGALLDGEHPLPFSHLPLDLRSRVRIRS
jgi:hypothetical protein